MRKISLRLPLKRRAEPVLNQDEIDMLFTLALHHVRHVRNIGRRVSESLLTTEYWAKEAAEKLQEAGAVEIKGINDWPETHEAKPEGEDPGRESC